MPHRHCVEKSELVALFKQLQVPASSTSTTIRQPFVEVDLTKEHPSARCVTTFGFSSNRTAIYMTGTGTSKSKDKLFAVKVQV